MSASSKKKIRKEQNAVKLTEKQQQEQKLAKGQKLQTVIFTVAVCLVLLIGIGSLTVTAYKNSGIAERTTTALTVGNQALSAADFNYFYIETINSFYNEWQQSYGQDTAVYLALAYGLDISKPLDQQPVKDDPTKTYADYFIELAVEKAVSTYAMYNLANANNYKLSSDTVASIDATLDVLNAGLTSYGFRNANEYLKTFYGNGANEKNFRKYLEVTETASAYGIAKYDSYVYTDSDMKAYNDEHFYELSSYSYDSFYLPVSSFVECTADEDDTEHTHSQKELDAAQKAAKKAAEALIDGSLKTTTAFNKAIQKLESFKDSSCTEYREVLYTDLSNKDIAAWLADSSRKAGDTTVVINDTETTDENGNPITKVYGYTVAVYRDRNDNEMNLVNVRHILSAFTGATEDEFGNTTYPITSVEASKKAIEEYEQTWLSAGGTEEAFAKLAGEKSQDSGSKDNGGLYENVFPNQMVPAFNNWCFDESRKVGDYGTVETEYGIHLIYFSGVSDVTYRDYMIENNLRNGDYDKWYAENVTAAQYTVIDTSHVDTSVILATD